MAPTNIKTVYQTSLLHIESSLDPLGLLSPTHNQRSQQQTGQITFQTVLINKSKFLKATHQTKMRKIEIPRSMVVEALIELVKLAREPASSRPKPCASLKTRHESCTFAAPCGPRRKENNCGQTSAFPTETSRFAPLIFEHRGSALPWLVDDRPALRLRRIWCIAVATDSRSMIFVTIVTCVRCWCVCVCLISYILAPVCAFPCMFDVSAGV